MRKTETLRRRGLHNEDFCVPAVYVLVGFGLKPDLCNSFSVSLW